MLESESESEDMDAVSELYPVVEVAVRAHTRHPKVPVPGLWRFLTNLDLHLEAARFSAI
jgi:hypothetical protein